MKKLFSQVKKVIGKILVTVIILQYIVGIAGFQLHHCCCNKSYHTTFSIVEAFSPYHYHNCKKCMEDEVAQKLAKVGISTYKPARHCGDFLFQMDNDKYENGTQMILSHLYILVSSVVVPELLSSLEESDANRYNIYDDDSLKRRWRHCRASLCTFII